MNFVTPKIEEIIVNLNSSTKVKYLDVVLDEKLKWNYILKYVVRKISVLMNMQESDW